MFSVCVCIREEVYGRLTRVLASREATSPSDTLETSSMDVVCDSNPSYEDKRSVDVVVVVVVFVVRLSLLRWW